MLKLNIPSQEQCDVQLFCFIVEINTQKYQPRGLVARISDY